MRFGTISFPDEKGAHRDANGQACPVEISKSNKSERGPSI